jgi:hypothetical protein
MTQRKPRDPRKERQWRQWLRDWRSSGLSVRAFCRLRGLSEPSFYAWRRTLQQRPAAPFVPVRVVADEAPATASPLELVLAGGRLLRVGPGFEAATLRQLLAVLEEVPPC